MSSEPNEEVCTPVVAAPAASVPAGDVTMCERGIIRSDLGNKPVMIKCGHCNQSGMTTTRGNFGAMTFGSAFALIFLFLPLVWLPFVLPSCKDTEHSCGNCGKLVGLSHAKCG